MCLQRATKYTKRWIKAPTPKRRRPLPSLKIRIRRLLSRPEFLWRLPDVSYAAVLKANIDLWTETNTKDKKASDCGYKESRFYQSILCFNEVWTCLGVCNDRCHTQCHMVSLWPATANCPSFHLLVRSLSLSWSAIGDLETEIDELKKKIEDTKPLTYFQPTF